MDIAKKETQEKGDYLFHEGGQANHFYILLKGCIKLRVGMSGRVAYVVSHPGEAFGWSSLIGRDTYSASAECMDTTKLFSIENELCLKAIDEDPVNGLIFFKHLALLLGNRLLQSYNMIRATSQTEIFTSFGSSRLQDTIPLN
ncbi:MAG: cyclic nucleotide-binding domain-containing protein [Desulfobacterales bacterium]|nr:cyclic nucleotide-binding domain-containing protein [Desulfobacterales bacterium]